MQTSRNHDHASKHSATREQGMQRPIYTETKLGLDLENRDAIFSYIHLPKDSHLSPKNRFSGIFSFKSLLRPSFHYSHPIKKKPLPQNSVPAPSTLLITSYQPLPAHAHFLPRPTSEPPRPNQGLSTPA